MLPGVWQFLRDDSNRGILTFLGGGVVVIIGGIWTFTTYFAERFVPSTPVNVTISDVNNYVSIVSEAPEHNWLLANHIDVLVKLNGYHNTVSCNFDILADRGGDYGSIDAPPFLIPDDIQSFRAKFSLIFSSPYYSPIHTFPFRVTCGGTTSNLLSVEVNEKF
jgi:hypothetical protein